MSVACYINEFRPLAETFPGRNAIAQHALPAFIDASCRREPDLESEFPSITALCRAEHFAPQLREGDVVVYVTKEFDYPPGTERSRRIVAVLRILKSWLEHANRRGLKAHEQAAQWYREHKLRLPSNCMVHPDGCCPLDQTDRYKANLEEWERAYRLRAIECGAFHACEPIFREVHNPPRLTTGQLHQWFGQIPNPRDQRPFPPEDFAKLLLWLAGQTPDDTEVKRLSKLAAKLTAA
ncbi:MAG: hypothetical protein ACI9VS_004341 [Candidatus Binatia bacterium]